MKPLMSFRAALGDPHLLEPVMGGESREAMRAVLLASQGEELTESELAHFQRLTGREVAPSERVREGHIIAGRRAGKSSGTAALAVYLSALVDYSDCLSPGERGVTLIIAENTRQARVVFGYVRGVFEQSPILKKLIVGQTATSLSLSNRIDVEVRAADFRGLRGPTFITAICDEVSYWPNDESANPDTEIIGAVKPGLLTTQGQLFTIGSPYARRGFAFDTFEKHHGEAGDPRIIVAKGGTRDFNPTVSQAFIDEEMAKDPAWASAEYLGEFRSDLEAFVSREAVMACVERGVRERPRQNGISYNAFVDPSGGSGTDSMTIAISHRDGNIVVLDAMREVPPKFSPETVVAEFCALLKSYGVHSVKGDRFASGWPPEQFEKFGVRYIASDRNRSELYLDVLSLINSKRVSLLDNDRMVLQFAGLQRRTSRAGRDMIDHPRNSHDDLANAVAGALVTTVNAAVCSVEPFIY